MQRQNDMRETLSRWDTLFDADLRAKTPLPDELYPSLEGCELTGQAIEDIGKRKEKGRNE